jgi:hypothetical protein
LLGGGVTQTLVTELLREAARPEITFVDVIRILAEDPGPTPQSWALSRVVRPTISTLSFQVSGDLSATRVCAPEAFTWLSNSGTASVATSLAVSRGGVVATWDDPVDVASLSSVSYDQPAINPLTFADGTVAPSREWLVVDDVRDDVVPPSILSVVATGDVLTLSFDEDVVGLRAEHVSIHETGVPAALSFSLSGGPRIWELRLSSKLTSTAVLTLTVTQPDSTPSVVTDRATNAFVTVRELPVTNLTPVSINATALGGEIRGGRVRATLSESVLMENTLPRDWSIHVNGRSARSVDLQSTGWTSEVKLGFPLGAFSEFDEVFLVFDAPASRSPRTASFGVLSSFSVPLEPVIIDEDDRMRDFPAFNPLTWRTEVFSRDWEYRLLLDQIGEVYSSLHLGGAAFAPPSDLVASAGEVLLPLPASSSLLGWRSVGPSNLDAYALALGWLPGSSAWLAPPPLIGYSGITYWYHSGGRWYVRSPSSSSNTWVWAPSRGGYEVSSVAEGELGSWLIKGVGSSPEDLLLDGDGAHTLVDIKARYHVQTRLFETYIGN